MKIILTAALAASLLSGTAAMAQAPDNANPDRGARGQQEDRKDQKTNGAERGRSAPANRAAAAPPAQNAPGQAAPGRAVVASPQSVQRQEVPGARNTQPPVQNAPGQAASGRAVVAVPQSVQRQELPGPRNAPPAAQNAAGQAASGRAAVAVPQSVQRQDVPPARNTPSARDRMVPTPRAAQETPPPAADRQAGRMSPPASVPAPQTQNRNPSAGNNQGNRPQNTQFSRGDRLPDQYRQNQYYVNDWQQHGLRQPPGGYRWVRDDNNDFFLALIATGVISDAIYRSDRDDLWRQHYSRAYSYNDDVYYQQCRTAPDPAGVLIGGLIGGLLGNAAGGGNRTGATIAGVIFGGAVGAALTSNMDCGDRSYAYKTYYNGFNSGRTGQYEWRNPSNNHRGEFRINSYYNDPYGFRCARFNQVTYIQGRTYNATGVACRQPDGSWAAVN